MLPGALRAELPSPVTAALDLREFAPPVAPLVEEQDRLSATLDAHVVAYRRGTTTPAPGLRQLCSLIEPKPLTAKNLAALADAERRMGVVLVAYERPARLRRARPLS